MLWNPARFIDISTGDESALESEQLRSYPEGVYMPWSQGERVCPGKRFSQVEVAAVLAVLFRKSRVEVVPDENESPTEARKRAQMLSLDIQMTLLNDMYHPERLGLTLVDLNKDLSVRTNNTWEDQDQCLIR